MFVKVKDLPDMIQSALSSVNYGKADIQVEARESVCLQDLGGAGRRGFSTLINLGSGEYQTTYGSWGGANAYCLDNVVDRDNRDHILPANGAILQGSQGGDQPTYARLYVHSGNLLPCLVSGPVVSEDEAKVLAVFKGIKSSYRKDYLRGLEGLIPGLVSRGFLKQTKVGATSITTEGKNACAHLKNYP